MGLWLRVGVNVCTCVRACLCVLVCVYFHQINQLQHLFMCAVFAKTTSCFPRSKYFKEMTNEHNYGSSHSSNTK